MKLSLLTIFVRNPYLVLSSKNLMHITLCVFSYIVCVSEHFHKRFLKYFSYTVSYKMT